MIQKITFKNVLNLHWDNQYKKYKKPTIEIMQSKNSSNIYCLLHLKNKVSTLNYEIVKYINFLQLKLGVK